MNIEQGPGDTMKQISYDGMAYLLTYTLTHFYCLLFYNHIFMVSYLIFGLLWFIVPHYLNIFFT